MTQLPSDNVLGLDKKKAALIKWAVIGVCCVVAAPAALLLLKGVLALAAAAAVAVGSIYYGPLLGQKMAVSRIKMEVKQAEENPIETLQNEYMQMQQDADSFGKEVTAFSASVDDFAQQTAQFQKEYPDDAKMFEDQLSAHRQLQAFKEEKYQQALQDLKTFDGVVKRAKAMWKMAQSSKRMSELAGQQSVDVFSQIRKETSLDAVRQATYQSFAEVRTALLQKVDMPATVAQGKLAAPQAQNTVGLVGEVRQPVPTQQ